MQIKSTQSFYFQGRVYSPVDGVIEIDNPTDELKKLFEIKADEKVLKHIEAPKVENDIIADNIISTDEKALKTTSKLKKK
jgi:hypothetical protein